MRKALPSLLLVVVALLAGALLLPILGIVVVLVGIMLVVAVVALLAAPLLARLPWFRDRIGVYQRGSFKTIRFGRGMYASDRGGEPETSPPESDRHLDRGDVIDVEGRELPDREPPKH